MLVTLPWPLRSRSGPTTTSCRCRGALTPRGPHRAARQPRLRGQGDPRGDGVPGVPPAPRPRAARPAGGRAGGRGHRPRGRRRRAAALRAADRAPRLLAALPRPVRHGLSADSLPCLVDALVVLLVRLHLADFFWGDVSLSNVLFRRNAGGFAAYLVDAETGELHAAALAPDARVRRRGRLRERLRRAARPAGRRVDQRARRRRESIGGPDRQALPRPVGRADRRARSSTPTRCGASSSASSGSTTSASTSTSSTSSPTSTATGSGSSRRSVEAGHHRRELQALTGLDVEDAQARRLLNDVACVHRAPRPRPRGPRAWSRNRWLTEIYEPVMAMVPPEARGQARAGRDLPRDARAPVVPLRARRPRDRPARGRARLHRRTSWPTSRTSW